MLFRHAVSPWGRMGAYQYRHFLFKFWFLFLPTSIFIYLGLVWIGIRYPEGAVKEMSLWQVEALTLAYVLLCTWPLIACTIRRIHDLDLRVRDVLWIFSPRRSRELGRRMIRDRGTVGPNTYGDDPEGQ